jgi:hypothetical protein
MDYVYNKAQHFSVWLGPKGACSGLAAELLQNVAAAARTGIDSPQLQSILSRDK